MRAKSPLTRHKPSRPDFWKILINFLLFSPTAVPCNLICLHLGVVEKIQKIGAKFQNVYFSAKKMQPGLQILHIFHDLENSFFGLALGCHGLHGLFNGLLVTKKLGK